MEAVTGLLTDMEATMEAVTVLEEILEALDVTLQAMAVTTRRILHR